MKYIWAIRITLKVAQLPRDLAMFNLALDSKLRGCDLVQLRVDDVALGGRVRSRATIVRKNGRPVQFEITEHARETVGRWIAIKGLRSGDVLFPSRGKPGKPMSTRRTALISCGGPRHP